jgi:hypothetical protein
MELQRGSYERSLEQQYEEAAWAAVLLIAKMTGERIASENESRGEQEIRLSSDRIPERVREFCLQAHNDMSSIPQHILDETRSGDNTYYFINRALMMGPGDKGVNPELERTIATYFNNDDGRRSAYDLDRFDDDIERIAAFYFPEVYSNITGDAVMEWECGRTFLKALQDSIFFIAQYDKERRELAFSDNELSAT